MAYQFFAKQSRSSPSPASPPPGAGRATTRPPIHPPPLHPPQSAVAAASKPKTPAQEQAFQPYPHSIPSGYVTPHPHITVESIRTAHIPSLTRITGLLLPIRYPSSFYTATITDPVITSLSRVAIYHDHPVVSAPASTPASVALGSSASAGTDKVIGGIRCRLERVSPSTEEQTHQPTNLYIQTLHLLSPYRGHGVAASLLNSLLFASPPDSEGKYRVSELVKHYNIRSVTAHVHEANEEGLNWYIARGFQVESAVVEGYYRRLQPSGARIVRLAVQWSEEDEHTSAMGDDTCNTTLPNDPDDEDWEKVEAEDGDEGDHGVQPLNESRVWDRDDPGSRKRKAEEDEHQSASRR
ncbi:hypothetical protein N7510_005322 [Penicillium lagena]|uniref:uncharacterized protein n=1 Tax=Penicillium lagena TaxID=94218 RepID=UPI00253FF40D|nr:uncharacterized protein N7510_005322 [Penicillium lagena]KAJ5612128.1 hypothetical protein N7510_005322 [Penicillium lagena]